MLSASPRISAFLLGFSLLAGGCVPAQSETPAGGAGATGGGVGTSGGGASGSGPAGGAGGTSAGGHSGGATGSGGGTSGGGAPGAGGGSAGSGGTASGGTGAGGSGPGAGGQGGAGDGDGGLGGADAGGGLDVAPLMECPGASIDRLQKWLGHANLVGSGGDASILAQEAGKYVAKARFTGGNWSEIVVLLGNTADASIDLSKSTGFTLRYSATADLYIEFRGTVHLHGGDQFGVKLPATGGMPMTKSFSFLPTEWAEIPGLDTPTHSFADVLKTANMFDIVGMTSNTVAFYGLRFDGYVPPCK
jgi:hypothetical protein